MAKIYVIPSADRRTAREKNKTYTVTSAEGTVLAKGLDKKAAAAMVREPGGPATATFKQDATPVSFAPAEQFTVREWAETLRSAGYMRRR